MMKNVSKPNLPSFRFLFIGGWMAVINATIGSLLAVSVTLASLAVYGIWQNGLQTTELNNSGFQSFVSSAALLWLVAILLSAIPAFIGGMLLAWLLSRKNSTASTISNPSKATIGALVGAFTGIVLALLVLVPTDFVGRIAHGGYGYNFLESLPVYILYSIEFMMIATIAGGWTDYQLRKYLENSSPSNAG